MKTISVLLILLIVSLFTTFKLTLCGSQEENLEGFRGGGRGGRGRHHSGGRHGFRRGGHGWHPRRNMRPYARPWWGSWWPSQWWPTSTWWAPQGGRYCRNCGDYGRGGCSSCTNCGFAINESGMGQCVPGGPQGPYFQQDATGWQY